DYTLARRVDDVETFIDGLGLGDDLTLVLHDWGGMIGMAYAARRPERVKRLVILNTAAFLLPSGKLLPWQLKLGRDSRLGALLIRGANAFARGASRLCTVKPMPREVARAYTAPYDSWANRIATLRFVQDIPLSPQDESFAVVDNVQEGIKQFENTPMMICWGGKDFVFDEFFLQEWIRRFPKAQLHRFPDA